MHVLYFSAIRFGSSFHFPTLLFSVFVLFSFAIFRSHPANSAPPRSVATFFSAAWKLHIRFSTHLFTTAKPFLCLHNEIAFIYDNLGHGLEPRLSGSYSFCGTIRHLQTVDAFCGLPRRPKCKKMFPILTNCLFQEPLPALDLGPRISALRASGVHPKTSSCVATSLAQLSGRNRSAHHLKFYVDNDSWSVMQSLIL